MDVGAYPTCSGSRTAATRWRRSPTPRPRSSPTRHEIGLNDLTPPFPAGEGSPILSRFFPHYRNCHDLCFPIWDIPTVPVHGRSERFPCRHIYCVGRTTAEHALRWAATGEGAAISHLPSRSMRSCRVVPRVGDVRYPLGTKDYHHEIELVVAIGTIGVKVTPEHALSVVYGYAVGLDMTRRDLQGQAKKTGRPWDYGKGRSRSRRRSAKSTAPPMSAI